ncbi:MAG: type 2 lanthipeptide synthetase LanM family protein [Pseudomonadota bacterium]
MPTEAADQRPEAGFLALIRPLLDDAYARLRARLAALSADDLDPDLFARLWAKPLPDAMLWMVTRAALLELYIQRLEGKLSGETPAQRFESFVAPLRTPEGALSFFSTYPVLARSLAERIRQWVEVGAELAARYAADRRDLETAFGALADDGRLGALADLEAGLGDRHQDGRVVVRFRFSCGVGLIYKPRTLALDVAFQALLQWLGDQGIEPRMGHLRVLDRGTHGWMEEIRAAPCADKEAMDRFYARQGIYLALLYALEATDMHHENVIASGEFPVLIDVETLFLPSPVDFTGPVHGPDSVVGTVLRNGLLPQRSWRGIQAGGADLSGLGAGRGQRTVVREIADAGLDTMRFKETKRALKVGQHRPTLDGEPANPWDYHETLITHFEATYRRLLALRPRLLAQDGPLAPFQNLETRVILRSTESYAGLVHASFHPDFLQNALDRDRLFDRLWVHVPALPHLEPLIPSERGSLRRGDFPRLTSKVASRDLWSDSGAYVRDALPRSGWDQARARIRAMGEQDLERQSTLVHQALATLRPYVEMPSDLETPLDLPAPSPAQWIRQAERVGRRLETLSFGDDRWISWFHLLPDVGGEALNPVDFDLYSGLAGIAVFYAELARLSDQGDFQALAERALASARRRLQRRKPEAVDLGGFSGLGGWMYALTLLGDRWDSAALLDEAEAAAARVVAGLERDRGLDVIAGSAGCIGGLLALYAKRPKSAILEAAVACGDHLLTRALDQAHGIGWPTGEADRPLTGFAHGTAGYAWALGRLAKVCDAPRFREASRKALAYERALFLSNRDNWPDLRTNRQVDGEWASFYAWCHGSPGIGLGRLGLLDGADDPELIAEIQAAVRSTLAQGFSGSHCLCHGQFGNLELLQLASDRLDDPTARVALAGHQARLIHDMEKGDYRCGASCLVELPGLMTGLAGIGYALLRLADPEGVPSVLLMEVPTSHGG